MAFRKNLITIPHIPPPSPGCSAFDDREKSGAGILDDWCGRIFIPMSDSHNRAPQKNRGDLFTDLPA